MVASTRRASASGLGANIVITERLLRSSRKKYIVITMTPKQSKMARAALGWSLSDWADKSGVGRDAAARFELGEDARMPVSAPIREKLEKALVDAGAQFARKAGRVGVTVPE